MARRRLSLEADQEKAQWALKQREANRRIVDTRNNLESIYQRQRNLNDMAFVTDQERKSKEIEKKIEEITNRRNNILNKQISERIEKGEQQEQFYKAKALHKLTELQVKEHEDHLKHFQKLVQKDDELEQDLYKSVKEAEFQRRKKDTELKKLNEQLIELRKKNATQIKELIAKAYADEQEFEQKIRREKAIVEKVHKNNKLYCLLI
jgi:hypothetical protein